MLDTLYFEDIEDEKAEEVEENDSFIFTTEKNGKVKVDEIARRNFHETDFNKAAQNKFDPKIRREQLLAEERRREIEAKRKVLIMLILYFRVYKFY